MRCETLSVKQEMSRLVGEQQEREENLRQRIRGLQESLRAARAENSIMSPPPQVALGSGTMSCVCACDVMCTSLVSGRRRLFV